MITTIKRKKKNNRNIPVNKGHFDMDTPSRTKNFHKKLGSGWDGYKSYRNSWEEYSSKMLVKRWPILIDVELASSCNLKCPMCYTTTDHFKENVKRKLMKWDLYKKVINETAGNVFALRLSWRGESTLHPKFVDAIKYAKERGFKEISCLTNGSKLDINYFKKLVEAGIDWITVSFDGVDEEYNKIRKPLIYEETLNKLKSIHNYKKKHKLNKPVIKVQGVWPAIKHNPTKYYNTLSKVSDLVAFNPLIDYLGQDENIQYEENFSCPQLYQRLFVSSTGDVMMCNSDEYGEEIVGNANKEKILEIWHGEKLNNIREKHLLKDGFKDISICRKCYYPRKTELSEIVKINGRELKIENYVGRTQEIGK